METEPTLLTQILCFIIWSIITGGFVFFLWFLDRFSKFKGRSFYDTYIK